MMGNLEENFGTPVLEVSGTEEIYEGHGCRYVPRRLREEAVSPTTTENEEGT